jgi:hypothetical protein
MMVRLIFTGSQPKKDAKFFISVSARADGWGGRVDTFLRLAWAEERASTTAETEVSFFAARMRAWR